MKIGFNIKKIINSIANHETRITTLENTSGGGSGGSSGIGLEYYTLKLYNTSNTKIRNINCPKLDDKVFLNFNYNRKLSEMNITNISDKYIKLGTVKLGNNDNIDMFNCSAYMSCYYIIGPSGLRYSGLLRIYNNSVEIIIDKDDIEIWKNTNSETFINIYANGIINTTIKA